MYSSFNWGECKIDEKPEGCRGKRHTFPSYYFMIFSNAKLDGKKFPFVLINKEYLEKANKVTTYEPIDKHEWLINAYKGINRGKIRIPYASHPGIALFHIDDGKT